MPINRDNFKVVHPIKLSYTESDPDKAIAEFPAYVRFIGDTTSGFFTNGSIYKVLSVEFDSYRIIDDTGEDYMYGLKFFEILDQVEGELLYKKQEENRYLER